MDISLRIVIPTLLLFVLFIVELGEGHNRCGEVGPDIRFPFRLKDRQLDQHSGYPGFDLYCNDKNDTVLELPTSVKVFVKQIDYKSQLIYVTDSDNCFPRKILGSHSGVEGGGAEGGQLIEIMENPNHNNESESNPKRTHIEVDVVNLPMDPGLRIKISDYHPNERDQIRRHYLQNKACQPVNHDFPQCQFGKTKRRFNPVWFKEYPSWLEYSITKYVAYCLYCFLFRPDTSDQGGGDSFVTERFRNWKKKEKLQNHVGDHSSAHNIAQRKCEALLNQRQSIQTVINKQSDVEKMEYWTRLNASVDCICFLQWQGLAFRGHDESKDSNN
ncbi:hypothetical protein SO802_024441 [Lithocarpus litseifolius]|uniref:TTF-type domain-containing protein n=1 Tax=Lithocarpus litseifolius TaxID=425828 RepID=A0AAW2CAL4_9ROSI